MPPTTTFERMTFMAPQKSLQRQTVAPLTHS
jgi:hypothetical protein